MSGLPRFLFIAVVLLRGSYSLFNLASNAVNHSSILPSLFSPSSLTSLIVEFMPLIWALTDCSTTSLVCFIITSLLSSDLLDALSICAVTSLNFTSSI